ncbi:hypothetical protein B0H19DRAFT_684254 [Mycena capillaripes]|nr:hypothetical protein B0H19DRAFT_684254 [Mycena capillaripes]
MPHPAKNSPTPRTAEWGGLGGERGCRRSIGGKRRAARRSATVRASYAQWSRSSSHTSTRNQRPPRPLVPRGAAPLAHHSLRLSPLPRHRARHRTQPVACSRAPRSTPLLPPTHLFLLPLTIPTYLPARAQSARPPACRSDPPPHFATSSAPAPDLRVHSPRPPMSLPQLLHPSFR